MDSALRLGNILVPPKWPVHQEKPERKPWSTASSSAASLPAVAPSQQRAPVFTQLSLPETRRASLTLCSTFSLFPMYHKVQDFSQIYSYSQHLVTSHPHFSPARGVAPSWVPLPHCLNFISFQRNDSLKLANGNSLPHFFEGFPLLGGPTSGLLFHFIPFLSPVLPHWSHMNFSNSLSFPSLGPSHWMSCSLSPTKLSPSGPAHWLLKLVKIQKP